MTRWPFPHDSAVDRARRVALAFREVAKVHGADVSALDAHYALLGEAWVSGAVDPCDEDLVTAAEAEELLGIPASRIRQWRVRGLLEAMTTAPSRYRVADIQDAAAARRTRRA